MVQTRTQIYLTDAQRAALDRRARMQDTTLAAVVRDAIDAYLARGGSERVNHALDAAFGAVPDLEHVDRGEWDRTERWS